MALVYENTSVLTLWIHRWSPTGAMSILSGRGPVTMRGNAWRRRCATRTRSRKTWMSVWRGFSTHSARECTWTTGGWWAISSSKPSRTNRSRYDAHFRLFFRFLVSVHFILSQNSPFNSTNFDKINHLNQQKNSPNFKKIVKIFKKFSKNFQKFF